MIQNSDAVQYFPKELGQSITFEDIKVTTIRLNDNQHITERQIIIEDIQTNKQLGILTHYHFKSWPDFEVPF